MKSKKLVIIESGAKIAKLSAALRSLDPKTNWVVASTQGGIKDLPKKDLGVTLDDHKFKITWRSSGAKAMSSIRKAAAGLDVSKDVYIATDGDREGELIAAHVAELLKIKKAQRLRIYEITEGGVRNAFKEMTGIDEKLVAAAEARRALDRVIGYKISPFCWRGLGGGTSAGRVQSCVLSHVLDRDLKRRKHKPEPYHVVEATVAGTSLKATSERHSDPDKAEKARKLLSKAKLRSTVKTRHSKPPAPFNTATALAFLSRKLGTNTQDTTKLLQRLYESGLSTYCRTDSLRLAPSFTKEARNYLQTNCPANLNPQVMEFKSRNTAQGAHEALRPASISVVPSSSRVQAFPPDVRKAYTYIWARALATQSTAAVYEDTTWEWVSPKGKVLVSLTTTKVVDFGWHTPSLRMFYEASATFKGTPSIDVSSSTVREGMTEAPPKLGPAEIVRWMEKKGVGRPATYAGILGKLKYYGNVAGSGAMSSTLRGQALTYYLGKLVPDLLDPDFTAQMERDLDRIALGKETYVGVLERYWAWLRPLLMHTKLETRAKCATCEKHYVVRVAKNKPPQLVCKCKGGPTVWAWGSKDSFVPHKPTAISGTCPKCKSTAGFKTADTKKIGVKVKCISCKTQHTLESLH